MCQLYGAVWKCNHIFADYEPCNWEPGKVGPGCPNTKTWHRPHSAATPNGFDIEDVARMKNKRRFIVIGACCSSQCCQCDIDASSLRDTYTSNVRYHVRECMSHFAKGLFMTSNMRARNFFNPQQPVEHIVPTFDKAKLTGGDRSFSQADLKDYREFERQVQHRELPEYHNYSTHYQWRRLIPYTTRRRAEVEHLAIEEAPSNDASSGSLLTRAPLPSNSTTEYTSTAPEAQKAAVTEPSDQLTVAPTESSTNTGDAASAFLRSQVSTLTKFSDELLLPKQSSTMQTQQSLPPLSAVMAYGEVTSRESIGLNAPIPWMRPPTSTPATGSSENQPRSNTDDGNHRTR